MLERHSNASAATCRIVAGIHCDKQNKDGIIHLLTPEPLQVARLARDGRFDYVLIESTGIAEPMHAAESFTMDVGGSAVQGDVQPRYGTM
jgi:hypothetical protein